MGILGELWVKLGLKNDELKKGLKDSNKEVNKFASSMKKLTSAAFFITLGKKLIQFSHQTAELANKASGVRAAFDKLNQPNLLANLRKATAGTVDDLQLMQRAVQANNFKIPLEQLATYMQFATKRAQETGQSVDYLVDSIILGLGRQSVAILDNLGISSAEIRKNMEGGATMAEAVSKIIKEQMPDAADVINDAAIASEKLAAAWTNFQLAVGDNTAPIFNKIKSVASTALDYATAVINQKGGFLKTIYALTNPIHGIGFVAGNNNENKETKTEETKPNSGGGKATTPQMGIIEALKKQIEAKTKLRELSVNDEEVQTLNVEISKLQEKLKLIQMTSEELKKYRQGQSEAIVKMGEDMFMLDEYFSDKRADAFKDALQKRYDAMVEAAAEAREQMEKDLAMIEELNEKFNQAIVQGISGGVESLVQTLMSVEGMSFGSVIQALLTPMADALKSAGEMIIAEGIAVEAFKESLKSLNGFAAIAAGSALVAVASAVKAGLASIGNNPTGAGGYSMGNSTSYSGGYGYGVNAASYSSAGGGYTLTTKLQGQDLLLAIQRTQANNKR